MCCTRYVVSCAVRGAYALIDRLGLFVCQAADQKRKREERERLIGAWDKRKRDLEEAARKADEQLKRQTARAKHTRERTKPASRRKQTSKHA